MPNAKILLEALNVIVLIQVLMVSHNFSFAPPYANCQNIAGSTSLIVSHKFAPPYAKCQNNRGSFECDCANSVQDSMVSHKFSFAPTYGKCQNDVGSFEWDCADTGLNAKP